MRLTQRQRRAEKRQRGFSLLEMLFATVILLAGLVGIAQVVPSAMLLGTKNRLNSGALVFAQRELEQMLNQSLSAVSFLDAQGHACNLGDLTQPGQTVGNPVIVANNRPLIDFSAATGVTGYSFEYIDPNDPYNVTYDVRWAVITQTGGSGVMSKRFILGVQQKGGASFAVPVTLDSMVYK